MDDMGIELTYKEHKEMVNHLPAGGEHFNYFWYLAKNALGLFIRYSYFPLKHYISTQKYLVPRCECVCVLLLL